MVSEIQPYAWLPNKDRQILGGMATDLDTQLGRVVDAFKARGWWNNTLLWLVADNGKPHCLLPRAFLVMLACMHAYAGGPPYVANSNWPMRGGKWTSFEGGTHLTAFAVHGGGLLPSKNFTGLAHHVDLVQSAGDRCPTVEGAVCQTHRRLAIGPDVTCGSRLRLQ